MKTLTHLKLNPCILFFLYTLLLSCGTNLFCQEKGRDEFSLDNDPISITDLPDLQVFVEDQPAALLLGTIEQQTFQPYEKLDFTKVDKVYWLRFSLENKTATESKVWLNVGVYDSLSLIEIENQTRLIQHRGLLAIYDQATKDNFRNLTEHKYGFSITLSPDSNKTLYLRVKNLVRFEGSFANITISKKVLQDKSATIWFLIFNALFFGILLFLTLFTLLQFIQNKDAAYWYYGQYLVTCIFYFLWKFEKANSFLNILFTDFPNYYYYMEIPLSLTIYISYLFFLIHFINVEKGIPRFYKLIKGSSIILFAFFFISPILLYFFDFSLSWDIYYGLRVLLILMGVYALYIVVNSKHPLAFYILTGSFVMLLGSMCTCYLSKTMVQHYQGVWDIPLLPIQIAILFEVFFFSIGLGYKSQLAEKEKTVILQNLKLEQREKNLEKQRKEQLTQWFTNISHEFRTPLTVILGTLSQIKGHSKIQHLIRKNGNQLLQLINQILDLNKLEAEKMQITWQQGEVMHFIRYAIEPFEYLAKRKNQSFKIFCFPNQLYIDFDMEKLQTIINNLVSNAIKFTPENGTIRINAYKKIKNGQAFLQVEVADSGPGIATNYHDVIFDYYMQLPETQGGTGLGLALAKELTLLLGGFIEIDSELEKGSKFTVGFPIHKEAPLVMDYQSLRVEKLDSPFSEINTEPISLIAGRPSLLLVEDNEDVQSYFKQLLKSSYNLFSAKNGREGFLKVKTVRPDLIISDVMMPEMNGYELCQKLKDNTATEHIPILLLTAKASHEDLLKGLKYKADAYMTKPFDEKELLLRLEQLLQKNRVWEARTKNIYKRNGLVHKTENEAILFMDLFHKILNENLLNEQFKTRELCKELGTNHVTINNKIKEYTGQTPAQYIRNYRLNLAKELLQTTEFSVAEISYKVGIPEPSNFNNMFKKAFGKSPKQWKMFN